MVAPGRWSAGWGVEKIFDTKNDKVPAVILSCEDYGLVYRLTERAHDLFPTTSNAMTIDVLAAAQKLFGPTAAEKLLLVAFQKKAEQYAAKLKGGTLAERAKWLARLRDHDGHMAECVAADDGAVRIVEHHSPVLDLLRAFPLKMVRVTLRKFILPDTDAVSVTLTRRGAASTASTPT